mmetsp:Transcript_32890/g.72629  ORF Transcript_32890/g.72629 Transcript_32890/m.72629 type:complete len:758 (-) Transcript_32890:1138-3411(-)|eukprot:CAMPEP_0202916444 /NCGR_PEP_ID=MMETSP1392-20130828/68585_1 /ASSEMBLY_ACC=CAM_ASM_000868 /TAXON_ID=225041 /ORGANISM="Chlamydomonas chlamydogama, Strain SAG 11-48b" /LENGTH=757 /DNA_ID=CAMNT_0049608873 /DNA_START=10 /DNA_END=2283 /DNA_ORIENTATION=+
MATPTTDTSTKTSRLLDGSPDVYSNEDKPVPGPEELSFARVSPPEHGAELVSTGVGSSSFNVAWINRVQSRTQELCKWFGIDERETLLDEFVCALRKRILLQGRIFIFDHYVCFSSNVFGYVKKKVISFSTVVAVRKKTHFRFPNSIEIEDSRGVKEFFTSFLSREDAFRLIINCWSQVRPAVHPPPAGGDTASSTNLEEFQSNSMPNPSGASALPFLAQSASTAPPPRQGTHGRGASLVDFLGFGGFSMNSNNPPAGTQMESGISKRAAARSDSTVITAQPPTALIPPHGYSEGGSITNDIPRHTAAGRSGPFRRQTDDDFGDISEADEAGEDADAVFSLVEPREPPPPHKDCRTILSTVLHGCSPRHLFDVLLSDDSHFLEDFLESQGNRRINLAPWTRHEQLGHVRDVQFIAPIKGAFGNWGVPHTQCYQSHRFCQYKNSYLVFESSQTMADIPYGDCFTVDLRWDVRPAPSDSNQLLLDVHLRIPFIRKCLFKKVIESGTTRQVTETYTNMLAELRPILEERARAAAMQRGGPMSLDGGIGAAPNTPRPPSAILAGMVERATGSAGDVPPPTPGRGGLNASTSGTPPHLSPGRYVLQGLVTVIGTVLDRVVELVMGVLQGSIPFYVVWLFSLMFLVLMLQLYMFYIIAPQSGDASLAGGGVDSAMPAGLRASAASAGSMYRFHAEDHSYWLQRLQLLHQEMGLLQRRMEAVATDITSTMDFLQQGVATAAAAAASAATGAAAADASYPAQQDL